MVNIDQDQLVVRVKETVLVQLLNDYELDTSKKHQRFRNWLKNRHGIVNYIHNIHRRVTWIFFKDQASLIMFRLRVD